MTETDPNPEASTATEPNQLPVLPPSKPAASTAQPFACRIRTLLLAMTMATVLCLGGAAVTLAGSFGYKAPEARLVQVTLKVSAEGAKERIYNVVTTTDGRPLKLRSGSRIPIKRTVETDGKVETSYEFQNVGFSTSLRVTALEDGQLRLEGELEDSRLAESSASNLLPTIEHHRHEFRGILEPGSELEVTSLTEPTGTPYRIEIHVREL